METTGHYAGGYRVYIGVIWGLNCRDNGKENGNYYNIKGYIGVM